jgi:hypothetical protein
MLTRKLTILAATTALGGTAAADKPDDPGCRGDLTSGAAHDFGGLGHATTFAGFPLAPNDLQSETIRPLCEEG